MTKSDLGGVLQFYLVFSAPIILIAVLGFLFDCGGGDSDAARMNKRIDDLSEDLRYVEMELDFVRNLAEHE